SFWKSPGARGSDPAASGLDLQHRAAHAVSSAGCRGRDAGDTRQSANAALIVRGPESLPHLALPYRRQPRTQYETRPVRGPGDRFSDVRRRTRQDPRPSPPDPKGASPDAGLLVTEAMLACTSGMLLCLDREQRLAYILGAIFGV